MSAAPLNSLPKFAVVGNPNKGKSSIVSTLTRQSAVHISELSGTTTESQAFDFMLDGRAYYSLIDTPGFQRPRRVLAWLKQEEVNAAQRKPRVQAFVDEHKCLEQPRFRDEVELLQPILEGAGIIYVVDGSLPYTPEFEAEMTILQWTSQPRMALINPIAGDDYVDEWQSALSQYFSLVKVFDPMTASAKTQLTVLSAFAELHEPWRAPLEATIKALDHYFDELADRAAMVVAEHLSLMLSHVEALKVPAEFVEDKLKSKLKNDYQNTLRNYEARMQKQLQALFDHQQVDQLGEELDTNYPDLFDSQHWFLYGLDRQKVITLSASAGVAAGAVLDASVGGASFMAGALAGGVVSGLASFAATLKPEKLNVKGVPLAGKSITAGPSKELNFSFVLMGRAVDFLETIMARTHANRTQSTIHQKRMNERVDTLAKVEQVKLARLLQKASKGLSEKDLINLKDQVLTLLVAKD